MTHTHAKGHLVQKWKQTEVIALPHVINAGSNIFSPLGKLAGRAIYFANVFFLYLKKI